MAYGTKVAFEPVREIAFGSVGPTFTPVGTPLTDHGRLIRIVNTMNTEMYISIDGVNDHLRIPAESFILLDMSANKIRDDGLFLPIGTQFFVREVTAPSSGNLWIEVLFAKGGV